ncbi:hypothetical protein SAMN04488505_102752 [Chitinophaga rupis]|uniref:Uncharacterized protein n=1 Tax=Chitinophaga rupis TaxID=573321 RepID=A0A1H7RWA9_9BACT|nr:hypothetical protein [Chitinophaga rupis]SEL64533.1 hypothetical protein SAMN04488505_102752 [Chitinophaga rupis]
MAFFNIEQLGEIVHPNISATQCDTLAEYCIVALENETHKSGCILKVLGDHQNEYELIWSKEVKKGGYQEPKKIVEKAAEAISFFLVRECTEYTVVMESKIGTGVDFWLSYDELHELYDPLNFLQARIEISGIKTESKSNKAMKRQTSKKKQMNRSDSSNLPAYVSIVEIATPKAIFSKK